MMLRDQIKSSYDGDVRYETVNKNVSKVIRQAVQNDDPTILENYFGDDAYKYYKTEAELVKWDIAIKNKTMEADESHFQCFGITEFLQLAFYYACKRGSVEVAKYLIEKQHLPGNLMVNLGSESQQILCPTEKLSGPPLKLAVESGNLDLVKYIYENTEAMIETSIGEPTDSTLLMIAVEAGNLPIAEYLIDHGGNVNSEEYASWYTKSPLTLAIRSRQSAMVALLVNKGAIVTNEEVNLALTQALDLPTLNLLFKSSVNHEDLYQPYLLSAVQSGNVELLRAMETSPFVAKQDDIAPFSKKPIEKRLLMAAAKSGSLAMMEYLVNEKHLDIKKYLAEEDELLIKNKGREGMDAINEVGNTLASLTAKSSNGVNLLRYLFETQFQPSQDAIEALCSHEVRGLQNVAYLHSLLEKEPAQKTMLQSIAFDFDRMDLAGLFKIYNTKLVQKGNHYDKTCGHDFCKEVEKRIEHTAKNFYIFDIFKLIRDDKAAAIGALFYYCSGQFDTKCENLIFFLRELVVYNSKFDTVDIKNCQGETLALYAVRSHSFNLLRELLKLGANLDVPDNKGDTALYRILYHPSLREREFPWVKDYISTEGDISLAVMNTLKHACTQHFGGNEEITALLKLTNGHMGNLSLAELLDDCKNGWNHDWKMKAFLDNLSKDYLSQMHLLQNDPAKVVTLSLEPYFSRFESKATPTCLTKANASLLFKSKRDEVADPVGIEEGHTLSSSLSA